MVNTMHEGESQNAYNPQDAITTLKGYMRRIPIRRKRPIEANKANESCDDDA